MRRTCLLVYIIVLSQVVFAQHYLPIEKYTIDDGLLQSEITCLFQDKLGFLWIGTKNGLNRFDGYNFFGYPVDLTDSLALPGTYIIKLFEDAQNNLWCISSLGLSIYQREQDKFKTYYLFNDVKGKRISIHLEDAALDWKRNIILLIGSGYIGKLDINKEEMATISFSADTLYKPDNIISSVLYNGLYSAFFLYGHKSIMRFDTEHDSLYAIPPDALNILSKAGGIRGMINDINGECLLYTKDRLYRFEEAIRLKEISIQPLIENKEIVKVFQNSPETILIITISSVIEYNLLTHKENELFTYNLPDEMGIRYNDVHYMEPGIFWIGTSRGLYKINYYKNFFIEHHTQKYFTQTGFLTALAFDAEGYLWLANNAGEMVVVGLQKELQEGKVIARNNDLDRINSLKKDPFGNQILVGTDEGLYQVKLKNNRSITRSLIVPGKTEAYCNVRDTLWVVNNRNLVVVSADNKFKNLTRHISEILQGPVIDMVSIRGAVYLLQSNQIVRHNKTDSSSIILSLSQLNLNVLPENICFLPFQEKELVVGTTTGLFVYYLYDLKILPSYLTISEHALPVQALYNFPDEHLWISSNCGLILLDKPLNTTRNYNSSDGLSLFSYADRLIDMDPAGLMCVAGEEHLILFKPDSLPKNSNIPKVEITGIELYDHGESKTFHVFGVDTINIETRYNHMLFSLAVLDFWDPGKNIFRYSLQQSGEPDNWIDLGTKNFFYNPSRLKAGDYVLKIMGANNDGVWSKEPRELIIHMIAPWWRSQIAIFSYIALFFLFFYLIILISTRQLRRINRQYREKEFTARKVEMQKEELTLKNKNITDSINYAKRIQLALMPSQKLFKKFFPDSFILHIPKDIVSGDFYWINEVDGRIYFAAVDCTGHGVPGAFMSIIGFELFRRITEIEKKKQPAEILKSLNQGFESIFRDIENIILRDGMDVAFCAIDPELKVLEFAGAFNPLYLIRDNTITEIKGDRFSVGLNQLDLIPMHPFNDHVIPLKDGDIIYIFTDGYADQFGGPEGKKYKYRRFRHLLLALHQLPVDRQMEFLRRSIMDWKGDLDQVDDILIMGIRISHQKSSGDPGAVSG